MGVFMQSQPQRLYIGLPDISPIFDPTTKPVIRPDWQDDAACRHPDIDPDLFFPPSPRDYDRRENQAYDPSSQVAQAKAICATCPVASECLMLALMSNTKFGIWGRTTVMQRKAIRRGRTFWVRCGTCGKLSWGDPSTRKCCSSWTGA